MLPKFVDAHHHLWELEAVHYPWLMAKGERRFFGDPTPIQKNYLPEDFLAESPRHRPVASVHIQVGAAEDQALRETEWLASLPDFPQAIVAFCDLAAPDVAEQLAVQQAFPRVRGVRQIVGRHIDEDRLHGSNTLLDSSAWVEGLRQLAAAGLSFDLQMIPNQMPAVLRALEQVPELPVALCHAGSPWDLSPTGLAGWKEGLTQLAALPNTVCKLSGLSMFKRDGTLDDLQPVVDSVLEVFTPARVMAGSNFPVDKLYHDYATVWDAYDRLTAGLNGAEKTAVFRDCAINFYRLSRVD